MKPFFKYYDYQTFDLTEGKLHRYEVDGVVRSVIMFPKSWEKVGEVVSASTVDGKPHQLQQYRVTEWDEVIIQDGS